MVWTHSTNSKKKLNNNNNKQTNKQTIEVYLFIYYLVMCYENRQIGKWTNHIW